MVRLTDHDASFVFTSSYSDTEFCGSGARVAVTQDSWTDAQPPNPCAPTVIQGFAEHVCLPADDPIEDFSEEDMATGSMAAAGRSPNKHPRTESEEDSVDIAALLDRAADRFRACMEYEV